MNHFLAPLPTSDIDKSLSYEWLETNGLGGYASSTLLCTNTRRYHGLLVAALKPPVERVVMLSKLDEAIVLNDQVHELGINEYQNRNLEPQFNNYLVEFYRELFPEFVYQVDFVRLSKTIVALQDENTTLIRYKVLAADQPFQLNLKPLLAIRDFHHLKHQQPYYHTTFKDGVLHVKTEDEFPDLYLYLKDGEFEGGPDWYHNFEYRAELERGQDAHEDLYTPGHFCITLKEGATIGILISTENPVGRNAISLFEKEKSRRKAILEHEPTGDPFVQKLHLAAEQFLVKREDRKSILAGYHWFSDWGRDTMISLPGLCLATEKFDTARQILKIYADHVSEGMLPNRFSDYGESPEYNNADATLWFFVALYQYLQATNDWEFVTGEVLPVLKEILWWHDHGTRYKIQTTDDGLLYAGESGVQISWMDAKVGDWVVTPRIGKAVEINALWYNAWKIYGILQGGSGNEDEAVRAFSRANQIRQAFIKQFWNTEKGYLYDYIDGNYKDDSIRPNQLFAISLPFMLLDMGQAKSVLRVVERKLYTRVGMRSLSADNPAYLANYSGDQLQRDAAYHQGVVWGWLIGPFVDALIKVKGNIGRKQAMTVIENFKPHLMEAGVGSISEIFEGDPPYLPKGCVAQAWSVAELLRIILSYQLYRPNQKRVAHLNQEETTTVHQPLSFWS